MVYDKPSVIDPSFNNKLKVLQNNTEHWSKLKIYTYQKNILILYWLSSDALLWLWEGHLG